MKQNYGKINVTKLKVKIKNSYKKMKYYDRSKIFMYLDAMFLKLILKKIVIPMPHKKFNN